LTTKYSSVLLMSDTLPFFSLIIGEFHRHQCLESCDFHQMTTSVQACSVRLWSDIGPFVSFRSPSSRLIVAQVVTSPLQRAAEPDLRVTTLRPCPDSQPTNDQDSPVQQGIEERDSHHGVSPFREQFQSLLTPRDEVNCACRVYCAWAVPLGIFSTARSQPIGNAWSARGHL